MTSRCVLIVDDDDDIRDVAQLSLEAAGGWKVVCASSGAEAIERAQEERPDAILLDVMMPDMDGPTTLEHLRSSEATRDIPVVFLTARARGKDLEELEGLGAVGVLAKPFDPMSLADDVARTLGWGS